MAHEEEGVIKFQAAHAYDTLRIPDLDDTIAELVSWREILVRLALIGQDGRRYEGAGFGNVSARLGPFPGSRSRRRFIVTGTQTGGQRCMSSSNFCVVKSYDIAANRVQSSGPIMPSSESLTHAAIYDLGSHIRYVFHGHCPTLWQQAEALRLPLTDRNVPYGTQAMAREVQRLYRSGTLAERRLLAMGGHEDGIISFGRTAQEAGSILVDGLARAYALLCRERGELCTW